MSLGFLSYFGVSGEGYDRLLNDLVGAGPRTSARDNAAADAAGGPEDDDLDPRPYDVARDGIFLATFDAADLVQVRTCVGPFDLGTVGAGAALAFRRAQGFRTVRGDFLEQAWSRTGLAMPADATGPLVVPMDDLLRTDLSARARPFYGVITARLSPWVKLGARISDPAGPLSARVIAAILGSGAATLDGTPSRGLLERAQEFPYAGEPDAERPLITPLNGLDDVEVIFLVRAASLGGIAGVVWALFHTPAAAAVSFDGLDHGFLRRTLGRPLHREAWEKAPLLSWTETAVGLRVLPEPGQGRPYPVSLGGQWCLDVPPGWAERHGVCGCFPIALGFPPGAEPEGWAAFNELIAGPNPRRALAEQRYLFFGSQHAMAFESGWGAPLGDGPPLARTYRVEEVAALLSALAQRGGSRIISTTTFAGVAAHGARLDAHAVASPLATEFHDRLQRVRVHHTATGRDAKSTAWAARWRQGASNALVTYAQAIAVTNLLVAVLDELVGDPERVSEAIEPLRFLVEQVDQPSSQDPSLDPSFPMLEPLDHAFRPWEASVLAEQLEDLVTMRARRGLPPDQPVANLALEGHAGYGVPRDAFWVYVTALARVLGVKGPVVVRDLASGRVSARSGPGMVTTLMVSAMTVHLPQQWVYGHELGHSLLHQLTFAATLDWRPRLADAWAVLAHAAGNSPDGLSTARHLLHDTRRGLLQLLPDGAPRRNLWVLAMANLPAELAADLIQVAVLRGAGEPDLTAAARRFWWSKGPSLVWEMNTEHGSRSLYWPWVARLVLQTWLVTRLTEPPPGWGWRDDLDCVLEHLGTRNPDLPPEAYLHGVAQDDRALLTRLHILRHDLAVDPEQWQLVALRLRSDPTLADGARQRPDPLVDALLGFCSALLDAVAGQVRDAGAEGDECRAFCAYLDAVALTLGGAPATPWLPFATSRVPGVPPRQWRLGAEPRALLSHRGGVSPPARNVGLQFDGRALDAADVLRMEAHVERAQELTDTFLADFADRARGLRADMLGRLVADTLGADAADDADG